MKDKKIYAQNNAFYISEKAVIFGVFAAIVIIAVGVGLFAIAEKTSPNYDPTSFKFFLQSLDKFTIALTLALGVIILSISALAFKKIQSPKFLLITLAFGLLVLEWILKLIDRYYIPGQLLYDPIENLIEMAVILFLAIGFFRK